MAKIEILQCDLCEKTSAETDRDGNDIVVETHRVALDKEAVDLEACNACWRDVRRTAVDNVFEVGRPVPRRGPRPPARKPDEATNNNLPEQGKRGPGRPRRTTEPAKGLSAVKP